ncbi:MAG TPA: nucleotide kinase domain-containing protein [Candidatus Paceibacterota bacterium]|nr:nucleotide kinase domain-containing protein [Candidatus Paceibacterota bacterium]
MANLFVEFAVKREQLRLRKEAGLPREEWTQDEILRHFRFTNVRRRDDRVSQWLLGNVLQNTSWLTNAGPVAWDNFLLFTALCRWVNWPPTIIELMRANYYPSKAPIDWKAVGKLIDARKARGEKAWTGAYMVRAKPGHKKGKGNFVAVEVVQKSLGRNLEKVKAAIFVPGRTKRGVWEVLASCKNYGSFMAGQIVDDWSWTPLLAGVPDQYTWAPQGPGSVKGLNRLLGLPKNTRWKEADWSAKLIELRSEIVAALGPNYNDLTLHDVQNVCCEFFKYQKVKDGLGRPRARYVPETAY